MAGIFTQIKPVRADDLATRPKYYKSLWLGTYTCLFYWRHFFSDSMLKFFLNKRVSPFVDEMDRLSFSEVGSHIVILSNISVSCIYRPLYPVSQLCSLSPVLCTLSNVICSLSSILLTSNGNASETKANESFDNGVFFDIEAKRTPSIVSKLFSKRSEHIRKNENYFRSEANTFDSKTTVFKAKANMSDSMKIIFEAKRTHYI